MNLPSLASPSRDRMYPATFLAMCLAVLPAALAQPTGFYLSSISQGSEPASPARLQVTRCCTPQFPSATVTLMTADGTASAGLDFVAVNTNLTFAVGEMTRDVEIPVLNDALIEEYEALRVFLTNAVSYPLNSDSTDITVGLADNDRGFVVRSAAPDYGYAWEDQGEAHFEVAIEGDFVLTTEASVNVATREITARAGRDYEAVNSTIIFAPGERVESFTVPLRNNLVADGDRSFNLVLSQSEGIAIAPYGEISCVIRDNELGYRLGVPRERGAAEGHVVMREGLPATLTLWRDGDYGITSSVRLYLTNSATWTDEGTATYGVDYPATNWVVTFGPGEKSRTFTMELSDEGLAEPTETLFLSLESLGDGVRVQTGTVEVTLLDGEFLPALVDPEFNVAIAPQEPRFYYQSVGAGLADGRAIYAADRAGYDGQVGTVILRVLANGRPDPAWQPFGSPYDYTALAVAPDGAVAVALGETRLIRLTAKGTLDTNFSGTDLLTPPRSLLFQPDGRILACGSGSIDRYLTNGTPDPAFTPVTSASEIADVALDSSGNLLVASFYTLERYRSNGTLDASFAFTASGDVSGFHSVVPLRDGKVLVLVANSTAGPLQLRLQSDGSQDPTFTPQPLSETFLVQIIRTGPDSLCRLQLAGQSDTAWPLERLQADGSSDPAAAPQQILVPDTGAGAAAKSPPTAAFFAGGDGSLLVAHSRLVNGQARNGLARLWPGATNRIVVNPDTARVSEAAGLAEVQIFRTGPLTSALTLPWTLEPVTAMPGTDYVPTNGTVTFAPGRRTATLMVSVHDNDRPDRDRLLRLRFDAPADGSAPPPAPLTIANDDPGFLPGGIHFLADDRVRLEVESGDVSFPGTGYGRFHLSRSALVETGNLDAGSGGAGFTSLWSRPLGHPINSEVIADDGGPTSLFFRVVRSKLLEP